MKKLLLILVLVGFTSFSYSQTLIQTFTDRCTGATQVFQIAMTGTTTVVFYNRAQSFTAADVQSGAFRAWLEETYAWWSTLNPCSAAQAESQTAQQTTQQTTAAASQAATNAAAAAPPPPPPPPNTSTTNTSTNATSGTTDTSTNTGTDSTSSSQSSDTSSTGSGESSQGETSDSGGGGESTEDSSGGETTESESEPTEETSSEESSESESEEEVKEEESKEEEKKEDESEEESEDEESSEDSEDSEEEEGEEKKKNLAPPILAANLMSNQMLDGTWSTAASFGMSQSSLTGQETYSANAMIWTNLQQFSLALSKSKVHFWRDKVNYTEVYDSSPVSKVEGNKHKENLVHHVGTTSLNYMNIFGTNVVTAGYSHVILGQEDNFWKGFAGGYAAMGSLIVLPESLLLSPSLTFFGTKPVAFRALPRWGFAPMVAISLSPIQLNKQKNEVNVVWNEHFNYIIGTNANFKLTQRFVANIGFNTINNTNPIIPTTLAVTIGARFAF